MLISSKADIKILILAELVVFIQNGIKFILRILKYLYFNKCKENDLYPIYLLI